MKRVVVVGAGIAGLAVAHALARRLRGAAEVLVLEKSERVGGNLRTETIEGFTCEWGPNGFLDSVPETLDLVRAAGIEDRIQVSDDAARKRFIFRDGKLHVLPEGPMEFLKSGLLSWRGKARIALEPLAAARPPVDETIHAFAARRIGDEAASVLIDSMCSGIFAGDAAQLSLRACFPKMWQLETDYGGLFRALLATRKKKKRGDALGAPAGRLTSFRGGIEELPRAVAATLGAAVRTGCSVTRVVSASRETPRPAYCVEIEGGLPIDADAVVLAGPAANAASILGQLDPELSKTLAGIGTAPLAVICLGYDEGTLARPLQGFGFLVPRGEGIRTLGVLWDSSIYPGRAPRGRALMRAMIGGAHDPAAAELSDERLLEIVLGDLKTTMRLDAAPPFLRVFRHRQGIPQYTVGHLLRLQTIEGRLALHPGLFLAGNSYRGVAINSCAAEAIPLADRIQRFLLDA